MLQSTAQLVTDPKLAALVDRLAASDEMQSSGIGPQGAPSALYAVFAALSNIASPAQMIALSAHQSPVVRGYVIWYAARIPDKLGLLYPLLGDFTTVNLHSGCRTMPIPIAHLLLEELTAAHERDSVQALLLRAARDPQSGALRGRVLELLAERQPQEAAAIAVSLLPQRDPVLLPSLLHTLGSTRAVASVHEIAAFADSPDESVRMAVAKALGPLQTPQSKPALLKLMNDPARRVRIEAAASYAAQPYRDLNRVRQLIVDPMEGMRESLVIALGREGSRASLDLALEDIEGHKQTTRAALGYNVWGNESLFERMISLRGLAPLMRAVLLRSSDQNARLRAFTYLAYVPDAESLPAFRKVLIGLGVGARADAIHAIGLLRDRESVPALVQALVDPDERVKLAAAYALVQLRARSALGALERAAAQEKTSLRDNLRKRVAELAAIPE